MRELTARMSAISLDDDATYARLATLPTELVRRIVARFRRVYSHSAADRARRARHARAPHPRAVIFERMHGCVLSTRHSNYRRIHHAHERISQLLIQETAAEKLRQA